MGAFPLEVFLMIFGHVSNSSDLLSLRALDTTFCEIFTPRVFRKRRAINTIKSVQGLRKLIESAQVAKFIEEIIFEHQDDSFDEGLGLITTGSFYPCEQLFSQLYKCTSLRFFGLILDPSFMEDEINEIPEEFTESGKFGLALLHLLSRSIRPPSLKRLALVNVLVFENPVFETPSFHDLLAPLEELSFMSLSDTAYEGSSFLDPICDFWNRTVPRFILSPCQRTLTSLDLGSDQLVGHIPSIDFSTLEYPELTSLSLTNITFVDVGPTHVEAFIIRHKSKLRKLRLESCAILLGQHDGEDRFWSHIWGLFETELSCLTSLRVIRASGNRARDGGYDAYAEPIEDTRQYYVELDEGWGYMPVFDNLPGEEEDQSVLDKLQITVNTRRARLRQESVVSKHRGLRAMLSLYHVLPRIDPSCMYFFGDLTSFRIFANVHLYPQVRIWMNPIIEIIMALLILCSEKSFAHRSTVLPLISKPPLEFQCKCRPIEFQVLCLQVPDLLDIKLPHCIALHLNPRVHSLNQPRWVSVHSRRARYDAFASRG